MATVWLKNTTGTKLVFTNAQDATGNSLEFEPGEEKLVHPATVKHPAVRVFVGKGLQLVVEKETPKQKAQESLPAPQPAPELAPTPVDVPVVDEVLVTPAAPAAPAGEETISEPSEPPPTSKKKKPR